MNIAEIQAKSILRKHKRIDSWFVSHYGMNLYRGCTHNCSYCDGRAEDYYVEGDFGNEVSVKTNAVEILRREIDPDGKRKPMPPGYILLGGGVGDVYQPAEEQYNITRQVLELIRDFKRPVHILTKSTLVKRDIDIIKESNAQNRAIVSFSFSSVDEELSRLFEPGVPSPAERLETIRFLKSEGIACGMYLMPVIPFISDTPVMLQRSVKSAVDAGVDFIVFSGLTLKEGRQKTHFMNIIREYFPDLYPAYIQIYKPSKWGQASENYYSSIQETFRVIAKRYNIPARMPVHLFRDILNENDYVVVMLEHIDYYVKSSGSSRSPYGYAAYVISQVDEPLSAIKWNLRHLKGIGPTIAKTIREILDTGSCSIYQQLTGNYYAKNH